MSIVEVAGVPVDTRHWIGGQRVPSAETFATVSPIDGAELAQVARGGQAEADAAVAAARAAFPGWAALSPRERGGILHRVADNVEAHIEELSQIETADNGSLLRSHRRGVMPRVVMNLRFFADYAINELKHPDFETRGHTNHVTWDPSGVAVIITPWNAPLMLATWRIGPALASGDTVVAKPPEWAPLTASYFAELAHDAGLPPGVFNVVQGLGTEAGAALTANPGISRICFTGSVPTAKVIAHAAADNLIPCSFELGGKSPTVILDDADLDLAVDLAIEQYDNAGQVCLAGTRLLVQSGIAEAFAERFAERAAQIRQGDPRDEETQVGPNIHLKHVERVEGFVERAKADGATIAYGGERNTGSGLPLLQADTGHRCAGWQRDPHAGGLRPGSDDADLRDRRGRAGARERHRLRARRDRRDRRPPARRGLHQAPGGGDDLGQLLLRARPVRPLRRIEALRDRARGRDLVLRLLRGCEEHGVRTERLDEGVAPWVK